MNAKIVAFTLAGVAAAGMVLLPAAWHALPHTTRVTFEEYDEVARLIFAQPLPDSARVMDCAIRQTPAGKNVDEVLGCSLSVDADEFAELLQGRSPLERRSASLIAPAQKMPYLADAAGHGRSSLRVAAGGMGDQRAADLCRRIAAASGCLCPLSGGSRLKRGRPEACSPVCVYADCAASGSAPSQ